MTEPCYMCGGQGRWDDIPCLCQEKQEANMPRKEKPQA